MCKKIIALMLALLMILGLGACGNKNQVDEAEAANEQTDIDYMDAAETLGMTMWLKNRETDNLSEQLAGDGLFYDPVNNCLTQDAPEQGYGKGSFGDAGAQWGYYSGVEDGKPVTSYYDSTADYTNQALLVQVDAETDTVYMNWVKI